MRPPIKYGLIFFGVSFGILLVRYFFMRESLFNTTSSSLIGLALSVLFVFLAIKEDRGGEPVYTLADGIKAGLITYAIGAALNNIALYLLVNVIDPSLIQEAIDYTIRISESMTESMAKVVGMDEAMKAEMLEEVKNNATNPFTAPALAFSTVISLIGGLIISLIVGAILRRG